MLSGPEMFAAVAIVFVGAAVMGAVSFGFGLVAAPVLLLVVEPQSVVVMVNCLGAILLSGVLFHTRHFFKPRLIWATALGGVAAAPIGVLALHSAGPATLRITIAVVILGLVPFTFLNVRLPLSGARLTGPVLGFVTSLAVTSLSVGGPLVAMYVIAQRWHPQVVRASLAFYFLSVNASAFALYTVAGLVHRDTMANIGIVLPGLLAGFGLAALVARRMNERVFRYAAAAVIAAGGTALLGRELV